ncbi:arginyltransferase [Alteromonadaceae bacterium M269]|nr:arginyltransferase [Alteromonadaceae bacterium M269]
MKFGITQEFACSYLPENKERLLVFAEDEPNEKVYEALMHAGFRRSGEQIYRPHCLNCQACQSIRIPVDIFKPSKSQKRIINKNKDLRIELSRQNKDAYYDIYQDYINQRHSDGSMYPATEEQYRGFLPGSWLEQYYMEFWLDDCLIGVAVTDELKDSLSALYTFFIPEFENRSLGTWAILKQIELAKDLQKQYLYLGYQIDECRKMNYKSKFKPNERFIDNTWYRSLTD